MLPETSPLAPAEPLSIGTDTVLTPLAPLTFSPASPTDSGNTDEPVTPVLPVTPEPGNTPLNPVNQGNTAGLPDASPTGNTDGTVYKTFRLPPLTVASMERVVQQLNEVTPAGQPQLSVHSYGVDLLVKHESARRALTDYAQAQLEIEQLQTSLSIARNELATEQRKVQDLTAQLQQQINYVARLEHQPTPTVTPPPAVQLQAGTTDTDSVWRDRYEKAYQKLTASNGRMEQIEADTAMLRAGYQLLPAIITDFCAEAARNSWYRPDFYQWYFNQLVAYHTAADAVNRQ